MAKEKLILVSIAVAIAIAAVYAFILFFASGNVGTQQPFNGMMSGMMEGDRRSKNEILLPRLWLELTKWKLIQ